MIQIEHVLTDRGSKYAASIGNAATDVEVSAFIKTLKKNKKFAKATHNSWAVIFADGTQRKSDDGENGAGNVILRLLEREQVFDQVVVVTRWYGGKHLGGDRFRHVQACVNEILVTRAQID